MPMTQGLEAPATSDVACREIGRCAIHLITGRDEKGVDSSCKRIPSDAISRSEADLSLCADVLGIHD